jgi:uncharacterized PurR-regulated membrane protein YhhQ (DUF165 family)
VRSWRWIAGVTALAIAELSTTTEAFAASTRILRSRGLFSYAASVLVGDCNTRVLQRCSARRAVCVQLRHQVRAAAMALAITE